MKIAVFTRELDQVLGGMERQILAICGILSKLGHNVTIYTLDENKPQLFYETESSNFEIENIASGNPSNISSWSMRAGRQKKVFDKLRENPPDVGISFMFGAFLYSRLPMKLLGIPLVLAERNSPDIYRLTKVRNKKYLLYFVMFFADAITVQFERYVKKYPFFLRHKMNIIPNSIPELNGAIQSSSSFVTFLFAGRFSFQKQIGKLIEAFAVHLISFPESKLRIYGSGEQQDNIDKLILELKLSESVSIFKAKKNIISIFEQGEVLCVPSIWEGFPNVLAEALSFGIPAIGFSNCDGVSDLITSGVNGWLAEDDGSLVPLVELLNLAASAIQSGVDLSENCKHSVRRYSEIKVSKEWEKLLSKLVNR